MSIPKAVLAFDTDTQSIVMRVYGSRVEVENTSNHMTFDAEYRLGDPELWDMVRSMISAANIKGKRGEPCAVSFQNNT